MDSQYYSTSGNQIIINKHFDESLDDYSDFLNNFQILSFEHGCIYDFPLDNLPVNIRKVVFPHEYKHPINNLSESVKIMFLSSLNYPYHLDNLPNSLNRLTLIGNFADKLDYLPNNLTSLRLLLNTTNLSNLYEINNLPNSLIDLRIDFLDKNLKKIFVKFPDSIVHLEICSSLFESAEQLPVNLKYVAFNSDFNEDITNFPSGLEIIRFKCGFYGMIYSLPTTVEKVIFDEYNDFIHDYELTYPNVIFICDNYDES
jgi:hypothetical protein